MANSKFTIAKVLNFDGQGEWGIFEKVVRDDGEILEVQRGVYETEEEAKEAIADLNNPSINI